jgi:hypothetical protein
MPALVGFSIDRGAASRVNMTYWKARTEGRQNSDNSWEENDACSPEAWLRSARTVGIAALARRVCPNVTGQAYPPDPARLIHSDSGSKRRTRPLAVSRL